MWPIVGLYIYIYISTFSLETNNSPYSIIEARGQRSPSFSFEIDNFPYSIIEARGQRSPSFSFEIDNFPYSIIEARGQKTLILIWNW